LAVFTVTTTADGGAGSLRQAITSLNASGVAGTIQFAIPGAGVHRINVVSSLPAVQRTVQIDGTTQPGYAGAPLIEVVGPGGSLTNGLVLNAAGSEVHAVAVGGFATGVSLPADNSDVRSCYVGIGASGSPLPNATGIDVGGNGDVVGGLQAGDRNVISGNSVRGVHVGGGSNNAVLGNFIGTDPTGTLAVGNAIGVDGDGSRYTIGGTVAAARNVISGNTTVGVQCAYVPVSGSAQVYGNYVGTDVTGERAVPNAVGMELNGYGSAGGGYIAGQGNVVSGNAGDGIRIWQDYVFGNRIGLSASGQPLGNGGDGISASAPGGTIGGSGGYANVIAYNGGNGVEAAGTSTYASQNSIYSNGKLGIDLRGAGVTPPPVTLTSASAAGSTLTVSGSVNGIASFGYTAEFYINPTADASGYGEGKTYLGTSTVNTDASGHGTFSVSLPKLAGAYVTAMANGYEFSNAVPVAGGGAAVAGRSTFYNASAFDWTAAADANTNGAYDPGEDGTNDDGAVATNKSALLPGQAATFANYTSYYHGLNGIMIDVAGLVSRNLAAADFAFKVGTGADPSA
jgi:hypothetical protein